jgi:Tetratricopeptide repeat
MKWFISLLQVIFLCIVVYPLINYAKEANSITSSKAVLNSIQGQVFDPYRVPISDIYVELRNDLGSTISRVRTLTGGRFLFANISSGHFDVTVLTTGTNFLEQTQSVDIVNIFRGSSDSAYVDFYLQFDKRKTSIGTASVTDAIFVQEIPEEARKLYKSGVKKIGGKESKQGFDELEQAVKIFPEYFDALSTLGREYVQIKEFQKAVTYLIRAIDINQRSFSCYYSLAYSAYKLNFLPDAIKAARAATTLQPNSVNAQLLYGTLLRLDGSYTKALEVLLKAKTLSKDSPIGDIHWQLALVYNKLNRNKEAADELDIYLKTSPDVANKKEIQDLIAKLRTETKSK